MDELARILLEQLKLTNNRLAWFVNGTDDDEPDRYAAGSTAAKRLVLDNRAVILNASAKLKK